MTLSGLSAAVTGPVTAEIEAQLVSNSEKVAGLKVLVLPERSVSVGIYRVTDPASSATSPVDGPTDAAIITTLNDIYKQASVKFSLQGFGNRSVSYDVNSDGRVQEGELPTIINAIATESGAVKIILTRESGITYPDDPTAYVRAGTANNSSVLFVNTIIVGGGDIAFVEAHEMGDVLDLPATNSDSSGHDSGPTPPGTGRLITPGSRDPISGTLPANPSGRWLPHEDWNGANIKADDYD